MDVYAIATQKPITCRPNDKLGEAIVVMANRKFRRLPVVVEEQLIGIITANDILKALKKRGAECVNDPIEKFMVEDPIAVHKDTSLGEATRIMFEHGFGGLPIVSDQYFTLAGIITERDLVKEFAESIIDANLADFVAEPITANYDKSTLMTVIGKMIKHKTSRILLTDSKGNLKGIISSSDVLKYVADKYLRSKLDDESLNIPVSELASTDLITVEISASLKEVAEVLSKNKLGGVPVLDNGKLVGIFSERDLLQIIGTYGLF